MSVYVQYTLIFISLVFLNFYNFFPHFKNYKIFNLKMFRYKNIHLVIRIFESRLKTIYRDISHLAHRTFYSIKYYNKSYIHIHMIIIYTYVHSTFNISCVIFLNILLLLNILIISSQIFNKNGLICDKSKLHLSIFH